MEMDGNESSNIEDRRGDGGGFGGGGFGGGGFGGGFLPLGGGLFRGGFGLIAIVVISLILGINPISLLTGMDSGGGSGYVAPRTETRAASRPASNADPETQFVARVLKSTEDVWGSLFQQMGKQYRQPRLVLYRDSTQTACGAGQAAMGPFYCPPDQRVYLDLSFFDEMASRGEGDVEQAIAAATAIGDDRLQRQAQGRVVPDSFTHGSSAQRVRWFKTGLEGGDMNRCDTFRASQL
jgi:uncharacterized protein